LHRLLILLLPLFILSCNEKSSCDTCDVDPSSGTQAKNEIFMAASTSLTERPMLVVRLQYTDKQFVHDESIWHNILFGIQKGELNHYYHEISNKQFGFKPVADAGNVSHGIVTINRNTNHPDPDIDHYSTFEQKLHPELKIAIETVASDGFDFSIYDKNGDHSITPNELLVMFIMAGEEDAYSGGTITKGVWAHELCTQSIYTPHVNGGVSVLGCQNSGSYTIFGERHHDGVHNSHDATIGIIAHELGHGTFNLPDLYAGSSTRIGYYGLMGNGSWGQAKSSDFPGSSPTHMTAWSKIDVGWFTPQKIHTDAASFMELTATGSSNYNIIKAPMYNNKDEYFLLENRGALGYDEGLKYVNPNYLGGIAIWHIDDAIIASNRVANTVNADADHKGVDLEEAAGSSVDELKGDPVTNLYYSSNVDAFTPNTTPNTNLYNDEHSYIFITDISSLGTVMSLKINNPKEAP